MQSDIRESTKLPEVTIAICGSPPCEHDFAAWRDFEDGNGGELFCTRCGLGAMAHTLSLDF